MEYLYFNFDGKSSSEFNLLIQNKGEDLSFPSQASFENQIASPLYQGTSYLLGVNKKDRVFNFSCWVDSITTLKMRELLNWLSIDKVGNLILDYNPNFSYRVKISSMGDIKHLAVNNDGTSNYEFQLSFITVGDFAAKSNNIYTRLTSLGNDNGLNPDGLPRGKVILVTTTSETS